MKYKAIRFYLKGKNMEILNLENVDLIYHSLKGETKALSDINFKVNQGDFIAIVGPSGCGKTTILNMVAGILKPTNGKITLLNEELYKDNAKKLNHNKNIGYMFQRDHLFEWRSIWKNVTLGLELNKKLSKEYLENQKNYVDSLLDKYGLKDFKNKKPRELSGGMRQRVALIRTLCLRPELLILDEPFSALDYQTRLAVQDDVASIIKKEKKTAILVTHDLMEAITMSDRIIVLSARPGTIKAIHTTKFNKNLKPFARRQTDECKILFDKIWQEIQNENQNKI